MALSRSELRDLCDEYMDPREFICGGGLTLFYVGDKANIRDKAKAALNFYNKKKLDKLFDVVCLLRAMIFVCVFFGWLQGKNFVLDKVVKVNHVSGALYGMTFWANWDENDERHLFRGVYSQRRGGNVLLCEIKDGEYEITIPAGHVDGFPGSFSIGRDHALYEWCQSAPQVCDVPCEDSDDSEDEKY